MKEKIVFCGLLLGGLCAVQGQSYLSTLNSTPGNVWSIGTFNVAQEFTTGNASEQIGSVSVSIGSTVAAGSSFTVSFFTDNGGTPGTLLGNGQLSGPGTPAVSAIAEYVASGLTLNANTAYWLVFSNPSSSGDVDVQNTDSGGVLNTSSSTGWTLGNTAYEVAGSPPYNIYPNAVPLFSIDPVTVPEPSTCALAGLGGLGLLLWRRRK